MSRPFIISLTSIPPRFGGIYPVLESLVQQTVDAVELWLPQSFDRFPDWDGRLPEVPSGVRIRRCQKDLGPATKFLPACAQANRTVLFCDDDCIYRPGWADAFQREDRENTCQAASTFSVQRLGLGGEGTIAQGFAGIRVQSDWFRGLEIHDSHRWVDDIWVSAQLCKQGIPIETLKKARHFVDPFTAPLGLQDINPNRVTRCEDYHQSAQILAKEFGIWSPS